MTYTSTPKGPPPLCECGWWFAPPDGGPCAQCKLVGRKWEPGDPDTLGVLPVYERPPPPLEPHRLT